MRGLHRLTTRGVTSAIAGRHSDGGGLYLVVDPSGARRWSFMYWRNKKPTEIGLGSIVQGVTLAMARDRAAACRLLLAHGGNPKDWRRDNSVPKFGPFGEDVIASLEGGWRDKRHKGQWQASLRTYCAKLADKAVDAITTEDVVAVLRPIWSTKATTAGRVRSRIEKILDAAKANGYRQGENPARWRGHLDNLLAKRPRLERGHYPAMPWTDVAAFVAELQGSDKTSARLLEFTILTAARTKESRDAEWSEFDLKAKIWTVPAVRMKGGREHRVPLTERACAIVAAMAEAKLSNYVFPGYKPGQHLTDDVMQTLLERMVDADYTVHGFRSTFKDWATECTSFPNDISEAALAHLTGDEVERAYRRTDALERRRELMEAWGRFLEGEKVSNVVTLSRAARS